MGNRSRDQSSCHLLQLPIYVCTQRSGTLTYYWECFQPVLSSNLHSLAHLYFETPLINALDHLELCHSDRCHYDTVVMSDGLTVKTRFPTKFRKHCHPYGPNRVITTIFMYSYHCMNLVWWHSIGVRQHPAHP